jgi:hypothetical protein
VAKPELAESHERNSGRSGRLETLARAALRRILEDKSTPAAALASAIRTALQLCGALGSDRKEAPETDPEAMSAADIDAALERLTRKPRKAP